MALMLPVIYATRSRAGAARDLSLLRQHAGLILQYACDQRDAYPLLLKPGPFSSIVTTNGRVWGPFSYFDTHRTWHLSLSDDYYGGSISPSLFLSSRASIQDLGYYTDFQYACAFIAEPQYWDPRGRTGIKQLQAVFLHQTSFPSLKCLVLVRGEPAAVSSVGAGVSVLAATVDGSAAASPAIHLLDGYPRGEWTWWEDVGAIHFVDVPKGLHTTNGVQGRDFVNR